MADSVDTARHGSLPRPHVWPQENDSVLDAIEDLAEYDVDNWPVLSSRKHPYECVGVLSWKILSLAVKSNNYCQLGRLALKRSPPEFQVDYPLAGEVYEAVLKEGLVLLKRGRTIMSAVTRADVLRQYRGHSGCWFIRDIERDAREVIRLLLNAACVIDGGASIKQIDPEELYFGEYIGVLNGLDLWRVVPKSMKLQRGICRGFAKLSGVRNEIAHHKRDATEPELLELKALRDRVSSLKALVLQVQV